MRVHFDLKNFEGFSFEFKGQSYAFSRLVPHAEKRRLATNISEYVFKLPSGNFVYLTVVGDEDQTSAFGVLKGWYVVESLTNEQAVFAIDALSKFTALYR